MGVMLKEAKNTSANTHMHPNTLTSHAPPKL